MIQTNQIVTSISDAFAVKIQEAYANGIKNAVIENVQLSVIYTGFVGQSSDPLNGSYDYTILNFPITGSGLKNAVQGQQGTAFDLWFGYIESQIRLITFSPIDNSGKITAVIANAFRDFELVIDENELSGAQNYQEVIYKTSQFIANSFDMVAFKNSLALKVYNATSTNGVGTIHNLTI